MQFSFLITILTISLFSCTVTSQSSGRKKTTDASVSDASSVKTIYEFKVTDIHGEVFDLATLKGKKVMIVNTASECGLTPQYKQLQAIYDKYSSRNFVIIGFPANNFGAQEPGSNDDISTFCSANYGVSFPMMSKISVKGSDIHPLYQFLTQKSQNGLEDNEVKWNFQKYLIGTDGKLVRVVSSQTLPDDPTIVSWIEGK